jgi:hypothetical protein
VQEFSTWLCLLTFNVVPFLRRRILYKKINNFKIIDHFISQCIALFGEHFLYNKKKFPLILLAHYPSFSILHSLHRCARLNLVYLLDLHCSNSSMVWHLLLRLFLSRISPRGSVRFLHFGWIINMIINMMCSHTASFYYAHLSFRSVPGGLCNIS